MPPRCFLPLLVVIAAIAPSFATSTKGFFAPGLSANTGVACTDYVVADFNRDGKLDIALTTPASPGELVVILGNGDGTFGAPVAYAVGSATQYGLVTADFNGDGKPDLIMANTPDTGVSFRAGVGDGTFQSPADQDLSLTGVVPVAVADLNGDGKPDLLLNDASGIVIVLGNGDGTFSPATSFAGVTPVVAFGDLNHDGIPDLVQRDLADSHSFYARLGNGDGTFQSPVAYPLGPNALVGAIAVADMDGDGNLDVVAGSSAVGVAVALGNGDGTFQAATFYTVSGTPDASFLVIADFNRDGALDVLAGNSGNPGGFGYSELFLGNGDGTLRPWKPEAVLGSGNNATVADFNRDGKPDFASSNVTIWPNQLPAPNPVTNGLSFTTPAGTTVGSGPRALAVGDFNLDGVPDLIVANSFGQSVSVVLGNRNDTFQAPQLYSVGNTPYSIAVGDFDRDGKPDFAVANQATNNVSVLLNNGGGTFQAAVNYAAGTGPLSVASGDLNGDGIADLAVAGAGGVSVLLGNGNGTFQAAVGYGAGTGPAWVAIADINRDGRPDLLVANSGSNNISLLLGNGDGTFQAAVNSTVGTFPRSIVVGDFNRDGKPDVAVANRDSNNISVLLGQGNGTFAAPVAYAAGTSPITLTAADLNDDGKLDLVAGEFGSADARVFLGNGDGTFQAGVSFAMAAGTFVVAVADFNLDGTPDLVAANSQANNITARYSKAATSADLTVSQDATDTRLTDLTATFSSRYGLDPAGTVTFLDHSDNTGGTVTLATGVPVTSAGGTGAAQISPLIAPGNHYFTAIYTGDASLWSNLAPEQALVPISVTLLAPNGGESLAPGTLYQVRWTEAGNIGSRTFILFRGGVSQGSVQCANIVVNNGSGSCNWTVQGAAANDYTLRITVAGGTLFVNDSSDAPFTITLPLPLTVVSPNGGEAWQVNTSHAIQWQYNGTSDNLNIALLKAGAGYLSIASNIPIGSGGVGSFNWKIPAGVPIASDYTVRISSVSDPHIVDYSNSTFSLIPWTGVQVVAPNGGESWALGSQHAIQWKYGGTSSNVNLALLKGGSGYLSIATNLPIGSGGNGSYTWTIPANLPVASDYTVRVATASGAYYLDVSDATFSLTASASTLTVVSPNGGESWHTGTQHPIQWNYANLTGNVNIALLKGGIGYLSIASNVPVGSAGSGSYNWTIPGNVPARSDYTVRISSASNPAVVDYSDLAFSIGP